MRATQRRAETATGLTFTHALSGRPVYFHSADMARNAKAEEDLRACYLEAGFDSVDYVSAADRYSLDVKESGQISEPARLLLAAHCRGVRLIDNCDI